MIVFILPCLLLFTGCGEKNDNKVYFTVPTLENITVSVESGSTSADDKGSYMTKNQDFKVVLTTAEGYEFATEPIAYINGSPITLNNENYRYVSDTLYVKNYSKIDITATAEATAIEKPVIFDYQGMTVDGDTEYIINNYTLTFNETFADILGVAANQAIRMNDIETGINNPRVTMLKYGDELKVAIRAYGDNPFAHVFSNPFSLLGADSIWQTNITDSGIEYSINVYAFYSDEVTISISENSFSNYDNADLSISVAESLNSMVGAGTSCGLFTATVNDGERLPLSVAQSEGNYIKIAYNNYETYKDYYDNATYRVNNTDVTATISEGVATINLLPLKDYGDPFILHLEIYNLIDRMYEDGHLESFTFNEYINDDAKYEEIESYRITTETQAIYNYYFANDVVFNISINVPSFDDTTIFYDQARSFTITATTSTGATRTSTVRVNSPDEKNGVTLEENSTWNYNLTLSQEFLTDVTSLTFEVSYS